jgi:type 1 fimbriae regulatory protein FimB/type 1 fimbriae regulatory protein FimE
MAAAKGRGCHGARDALAIYMCWRHGLRASELCALRWNHIEWRTGRLTVQRPKGSIDSTHPLSGEEKRRCMRCSASRSRGRGLSS